jgi:hypothetical protein
MNTKFKFMAVVVLLSLLLTACSVSITTKVNGDGSGELGFAYKFTKDDLSQLSTYGMNSDTICSDMESQGGSDMPADFTFKQETHGDETWCVGAKQFDNLDALMSEINGEGFTVNKMEISGGKFVFDANADMTSSDTSGMPFSINIAYDLTAPGSIDKGKSDADSYNGNTASWSLSLGGTRSMHLESSTSGGSSSGVSLSSGGKVAGVSIWIIVVVVCCCLLLVVIIVVAVFYFMRRKPKQPGM